MTSLRLSRQPTAPRDARRYLRPWLRDLGFSEDVAEEMLIAVGEAVTNAVLYGTPPPGEAGADEIAVSLEVEAGSLVIAVTSPMTGWTIGPVTRPDPMATRGRGLFVIQNLTDAWKVTQGPGGTTVYLSRRLPSQPAGRAGRA